MEFFQIWNKKITADRVAGADTELAAAEGFHIHNLILTADNQVDRRFNMFKQNFAFRRHLYPFGISDKKWLFQLFFQRFDRLTDSGLGNKQLF